jgi:5-methylcytosine-specific restriction endonuclease McrA
LIPSEVKREVWKRDGGKCVMCGANHNLHYDHDIPFSRGGSSIVAENVRLLCAKHNLSKSDKIMSAAVLAHLGFGVSLQFYN